jgi:hypothetical protein
LQASSAEIDLYVLDAGLVDALGRVGPDFVAIVALFGDEGGFLLKIECDAEATGHDSCAIRAMDGASSLRALLGLYPFTAKYKM